MSNNNYMYIFDFFNKSRKVFMFDTCFQMLVVRI